MRTEPEVTRAVRSWLEEGADRLPERVLDSVLDAVPSTPQRRSWWPPRRRFEMTSKLQIAAVAVAIVAVVFVGWRLLPAPSGVGGPEPTVTPSSSPSASPSPASPSPIPATSTIEMGVANRRLPAGTYRVADPFRPYTISFPAAWTLETAQMAGIALYRTQPANFAPALTINRVHRVYADPCHPDPALPSAAPAIRSGDEIIAQLSAMKGFTAGPVSDVTVGGHPARTFRLTNDITLAEAEQCEGSPLDMWEDGLGRHTTNQGATDQIWVVDVSGTPVTIDVQSVPGQTPVDLVAEAEAVVASIAYDE